MASNDSDVPKSLPATSTTTSTSGSSASTSHRSCPRCARRMSSVKFDQHLTCVKCRDKQCSVDVRCSECEKWTVDFMLAYVKHQRTLVSKGGKSKSSSSSSSSTPPVVTVTTTPPPPTSASDSGERLKSLMHSFLSDFFAQSPQLGTNPFLSAPPAVLNSSNLLREAAGGVGAVTPFEAPPTETPGEVLPMTQVDHPPPIISVHNVSLVRGIVSMWGSPYPGLGHSVRRDACY